MGSKKRHHGHKKSHRSHQRSNKNYPEFGASTSSSYLDNNYVLGDYNDVNNIVQDNSSQHTRCNQCSCSNNKCCEKR